MTEQQLVRLVDAAASIAQDPTPAIFPQGASPEDQALASFSLAASELARRHLHRRAANEDVPIVDD